jgi:DNA repair exonuclease SbcCD nuclease subunit
MRTKPIQTNKDRGWKINSPDLIPSAILCSDIHLREQTETPTCRTDDWWIAQWRKVQFIVSLQRKYECPVIHAGDLFDHWKPSPHLLSNAIANLPDMFATIYGQHDLPQHNLELAYKSGINTLAEAGKLEILDGVHFGQFPTKETTHNKILVWHTFNFQGKPPWLGCEALPASKLLKKYPEYDLIVTGDNHQSFVEEYEGRICVNPGSMMRMTADQQDFRPSVYLWYAETNTVERVYLPIEPDVISREHIDRKQERDNRLEAFVSRLNTEWEADVSFEENVNRMMEENSTADSIREIVNKAVFE